MAAHEPSGLIAKYEILGLVGEGAMGNVYRARDPLLNRIVAVKVMNDAIARDGELRDRFMREAQAAGSLQHPNVVTVYDFGEFEGHLYIAMEFVAGVDLETIISEKRPLPLHERLGIVVDVLVGLSYAHKHGVVHRDIKPANIRVGEDGRARIMDFGIAHLASARMTQTGMMMGTPNYMAPEQVTGDKITPSTDIFSVGSVLYELLTGEKAFAGQTIHTVLFKVVSEDPRPLLEAAPRTPPALAAILQRSLTKNVADRYQSAVEMANDLNVVRTKLTNSSEQPESLSLSATLARQARSDVALPPPAASTAPATRPARGRTVAIAAASVLAISATTWVSIQRSSAKSSGAIGSTAAVESSTTSQGAPPAVGSSSLTAPAGAIALLRDSVVALPATASREASIVRLVRTSTIAGRLQAAQGGAPKVQLDRGDVEVRRADALAAQGRNAEAVQALNAALAIWREAERSVANSRDVRTQPDTHVAPSVPVQATPLTSPVAPPAAPPQEPARREPEPVALPVVKSAPPPVVESPASVGAEVQVAQLITDYARAIESRDITRVREVYPAITAEQSQRFTQFFGAVRSLRASFAAAPPDIAGNIGSTRVNGSYEFVDQSGKSQRQAVSFTASFRRDGERWHIAGVR